VALLVASLRAVVAPLEMRLGGGDRRLADARQEIRRWLSDLAMDPGRAEDLVLAASEALTNAVEPAYDGRGTGPGELRRPPATKRFKRGNSAKTRVSARNTRWNCVTRRSAGRAAFNRAMNARLGAARVSRARSSLAHAIPAARPGAGAPTTHA